MKVVKREKRKRFLRSGFALFLAIAVLLTSIPDTGPVEAAAVPAVTKTAAKTSAKAGTEITVTTQKKLLNALADKKITKITIQTAKKITFTIPKKSYKSKTMVIDSAKATIVNNGLFKSIIVKNATKITEKAKGNSVVINDSRLTYEAAKSSNVKTLTYDSKNGEVVVSAHGTIEKIILVKKAELTVKGSAKSNIPVQINAKAKGSAVTASVPASVTTAVDADITFDSGAEGSLIISTNESSKLAISNQTSKRVEYRKPNEKKYIEPHTKITDPGKETDETKPSPTPSNAPTTGGGWVDSFFVTFESNGGTALAALTVPNGETIDSLPVPQKSSSIFLGWYTDKGFQESFTTDSPVLKNITLYARYSEIEMEQQALDDTFSLADQETGLAFTILSSDASMSESDVISGITLTATDGSEAVKLKAQGSAKSFLVSAQGGFVEGASYNLALSDSKLSFKDQDNTVRKCDFVIKKAEVYNIEFHEGILYIPDNVVSDMTENGEQVKALSVPVFDFSDEESTDNSVRGSFTYTGNKQLKTGDILCVYSDEKPQAPVLGADDASYMDDDIAYIKVTAVAETSGSQRIQYTDAAAKEVIFMPDVLPISVGEGNKLENYVPASSNAQGSFTIEEKDLNFSAYADMQLSEETTIDKGDFIALYSGESAQDSSQSEVSYGEITGVQKENNTYSITFTETNQEKMQEVLDYYSKNNTSGDSMLKGVDVDAVEAEIEKQVIESGYAEKASLYMTALALETDGFSEMSGIGSKMDSLSVKMSDGSEASVDDIRLMAASASGSKVKIENLKIKTDIGKKLQKLNGSGIRCAVNVSFDVSVKAGDDSSIKISLSSSFIEELKMDVGTSGKAIWKKLWIFPYIADYQMNANIDIYNYTGINFKAVVATKSESIDVSKEIQEVMSSTKPEEISSGVKELFELYSDMMENDTDWIEIFDKEIMSQEQHLLLGIIAIKESVDFVVSANINVALGCNFEYQNGTRYCFWAKIGARDAGSETLSLMDEKYTFQFYVMGSLGLRAGIRLEFAVGLFSTKLDSVGLTAEAGVYTKLYGYFFYQLESVNKLKSSKMSGALYLDFGIYLELAFKAQVLNGKYQYNPTLYEKEWPLLTAGTKYNVYDFSYDQPKTTIKMKDTTKTYTLPDSTFNMTYLDLKEGDISTKNYKASDYTISFTNSKFSLSGNQVKVSVPSGTHKLETDMIITWKGSSLAFSSLPVSRTFHLVWDDLNDNGYTISYNSMGGSTVSGATYKYEAALKAPTAPVRPGYTFGGWYRDEKLTTPFAFTTMPAENIILYAKWIENTTTQYRVEHYQQNIGNDNYTLYETEAFTGTTGQKAAAAAKSYVGFTYDNSTAGTVSTGAISGEGSLVLKQYYKRNSYTLTFKPENGNSDIVKALKYGAAISAPGILVKNGYNFMGWNSTVASTMPANDLTYTAVWTLNDYSIVFDSNGGSAVSKITAALNSPVSEPLAPVKAGYLFGGWYRDRGLTIPYTFSTMEANNITLYAKWELNTQVTYTVEHYQQNLSGDGYTMESSEYLAGVYNTTVTAQEKTYMGFAFDAQAGQNVKSGVVAADGSLVLKLYYDRNSYSLTFKPDNEDEDIVMTMKYGEAVSAQEVEVVKTGYHLSGWYSDSDLTTVYTFTTMPAENIILYAKWTENTTTQYRVEHYQQNIGNDNYTLYETETLTGTTGQKAAAAAKSYLGFTYDSSAAGTVSTGTISGDGSLVLKQYYNRNSYMLTFKPDNGDSDIVTTMKYGAAISAPGALVKNGHSFMGWNTAVASTMPANDLTYTAVWTPNNYSIVFDSNGGSAVSKITAALNSPVSEPSAPVKVGYLFGGWYRDHGLTIPYTFSTMEADNITLYAKWELNAQITYTVEHYQQNLSGDGYTMESSEHLTGAYNTTVTAQEKTYLGFTFNAQAGQNVKSGIVAADGSLVLKLYYDRSSYILTFKPDNGDEDIVMTMKYGAAVSAQEVVKEGYYFSGWYSDSDLTTVYTFTIMPAVDVTVYAKWMIASTITFDSNGGSLVAGITQESGSAVSAPNAPAKTGYIFNGWYSDSDLTTAYTFNTMPAESITLYAKWLLDEEKNTLTVNGDEARFFLDAHYASEPVRVKVTHSGSKYILYMYGLKSGATVTVTGFSIPISNGSANVAATSGWNAGSAMTDGGRIEMTITVDGSTTTIVAMATES